MRNQNTYLFSEQIILIGFEWWCIFQHVWLHPEYIIPTQLSTLSWTGHQHLFIFHIKPGQKQIYQLFFVYFPDEPSDSKRKQYFFSNFQVRDVITHLWLFFSTRKMSLEGRDTRGQSENFALVVHLPLSMWSMARHLISLCLVDKEDKDSFPVYSMMILIELIPITS